MAQSNRNAQEKVDAMLPVLATAALNGGDEHLRGLLTELVQEQLDRRRKEQQRLERLALNSVEAAKENVRVQAAQQKTCSHRKQDNTTRLAGQYLSGTGQLALVCGFCGKNYHQPPLEGQEAPPRELIPSADVIGG